MMALGVISLNVILRMSGSDFMPCSALRKWNEIASPSRSLSEARRMVSAFLAFCFRSLRIFAFPRTVMYSGSKVFPTSMASRDFGRSMRCPMEAATVYPLPRYFSIVLPFAGDSTIRSTCFLFLVAAR
jgi:hypothetical protein